MADENKDTQDENKIKPIVDEKTDGKDENKTDETNNETATQTQVTAKDKPKKKVTDQRSGDSGNDSKLEPDGNIGDTTNVSGEPQAGNTDILLSIGCKIPNGVVITVDDQQILLKGVNDMPDRSALRSYGGIGYTKIKQSVWEEFKRTHQKWPPIQNGSIFAVEVKSGG